MNYTMAIPEDLFDNVEIVDGNVTIQYAELMLLRQRIAYLEGVITAREITDGVVSDVARYFKANH